MSKPSHTVAAVLLAGASSLTYAGTASVGNTVRTFSDTSRITNSRAISSHVSAPNARNSALVLPAPRMAAMTIEPKVVPLDQLRGKSLQEAVAAAPATPPALEDRSPVAFGISWRTQPGIVNPQEIVSRAHNLRRSGLPIVHLWQSNQNLVALGLSPRGVPGVYFTQSMSK